MCLDSVVLVYGSECLVFLILLVVLFGVFEFFNSLGLISGCQVLTFSPALPVVCLSTESVRSVVVGMVDVF